MNNNVLGLEVDALLDDDETPLEVVGCVKYLDADGNVNFLTFKSPDLTTQEAYGMCKQLEMLIVDELDVSMYVYTEGDDD